MGAKTRFYTPFKLRVEPMARLLLVNLSDGTHYKGFEPQWLDDAVHGRGLLVIAYRQDGKVDVYHQPTVRPDPEGYEIEEGLGAMVACAFERARFAIGDHGVDADIAFTDRAGRPIVIRIREQRGKRAGRFSLLAPLGLSVKQPREMPLFFMYDFSFVKIRGTAVNVTVDGAPQKLIKLPVILGGGRIYIARYCGDPLIAFFNTAAEGPLPGHVVGEDASVEVDGACYELAQDDGRYAITAMRNGRTGNRGYPAREVGIRFDPPFPDVVGLSDGADVSGRFTIAAAPEAGEVPGAWRVQRDGDRVHVRLHPDGGWQPGEPSLMGRLIFFLLRPFRQWPKTYEWTAEIDLSREAAPTIRSGWRRLGE